MAKHWNPQEDYCVRFSDETALDRSDEELNAMVHEMRVIANKHGFDLSQFGSWPNMRRFGIREEAILEEFKRLDGV